MNQKTQIEKNDAKPHFSSEETSTKQLIEKKLNLRGIQTFATSAWIFQKYQPKQYSKILEATADDHDTHDRFFIGGKIKATTEKAILLAHMEGEDWIAKSQLKVWITENVQWEQI